MTKTIDYFFAAGSPWALLGHDAFIELARKFDATVRPHPITIIAENGAIPSKARPEPRRQYWLRDIKRWSVVRGLDLKVDSRPALADPTPASLTIVAAILDGDDWSRLTRVLQSALWIDAADIGLAAVRVRLATDAGFDGDRLVAREADADVQARWQQNLETARTTGIFGSPTYVIDGQPYWGQDTLPFLEKHLAGHPLLPS